MSDIAINQVIAQMRAQVRPLFGLSGQQPELGVTVGDKFRQ